MEFPPLAELYSLVTETFGKASDDELRAFSDATRTIECIPHYQDFFKFATTKERLAHTPPIYFAILSIRRIVEQWGPLLNPDELFSLFHFLIAATGDGANDLLSPPHTHVFEELCHSAALVCRFLVVADCATFSSILEQLQRLWDSDPIRRRIALVLISDMCSLFKRQLDCLSPFEHLAQLRLFQSNLPTLFSIVASVLLPTDDHPLLVAALHALEEILAFPEPESCASPIYTITHPPELAGALSTPACAIFVLEAAARPGLAAAALPPLSLLLFAAPALWGSPGNRVSFLQACVSAATALLERPPDAALFSRFLFRLATQLPAAFYASDDAPPLLRPALDFAAERVRAYGEDPNSAESMLRFMRHVLALMGGGPLAELCVPVFETVLAYAFDAADALDGPEIADLLWGVGAASARARATRSPRACGAASPSRRRRWRSGWGGPRSRRRADLKR
jgi:hypothetical protein